jgi:hypothetical protein
MADYDVFTNIGLIVVSAAIGALLAWVLKRGERKDTVEKIRQDKATSERQLAKELRDESEEEAVAVRQEMRDHIGQIIDTLKSDIALQKEMVQSQMNMRDMRIEVIRKQLDDYIETQNKINEKVVKSIEFVQTMLWGPEAKSMPPYMLGEQETQEHKDEPDVGMFAGRNGSK